MEHDIVFAAERLRHVVSAVAMRRRRHGSLVFVRRRGQPSVFRRQQLSHMRLVILVVSAVETLGETRVVCEEQTPVATAAQYGIMALRHLHVFQC